MVEHIQSKLDQFTNALSMDGAIDLREPRHQRISRSTISIENSLHFAAFDQSDEALLNDYEALLSILDKDDEVSADFGEVITSFLQENPESFERIVNDEWGEMSLPQRLVYESPVPLNEEQRKIMAALDKPDCRFLAIQGPPGTGKSHTITACVFRAILDGKNVLVLSDKKEALDVVENKISQTLKKVRVDENFVRRASPHFV